MSEDGERLLLNKATWLAREILSVFQLTGWDVAIALDDRDREDGVQAIVEAFDEYEKALITLFPVNIDGDDELVRVMIHEMIHVLLSPVFRIAEYTEGLGNLLHYSSERTTLRVERAIRNLGLHDSLLEKMKLAFGEVSDEAESRADREQPEV